MEKLYWVSAIIQGYNNEKPWLCAMNEGQINFDESMSIINRLRDNYDVLSAWIDTFDVSGEKKRYITTATSMLLAIFHIVDNIRK